MKKLVLFLISLSLSLSLYSVTLFDSTVPLEYQEVIAPTIDAMNRGRDDVSFYVGNFNLEDVDSTCHISFDLSFLDKNIRLESYSTKEDSIKALRREVENALYYEKSLFIDGTECLDYIYSGSFSFVSDTRYRKGTTLNATDVNGKIKAVFEVRKVLDDVTLLQPIYLKKDVVPGLSLNKASSFRYAISGATNFYLGSYSLSFEISNTSWIYPFSPIFSIFYEERNGSRALYGGIGLTGYIDLNDIFPWSFTLIQEGKIGANATLLLGAKDGSFAYNGAYSIYYEHRVLPKMFYRIGYGYYPIMGHSLVLSLGGSF